MSETIPAPVEFPISLRMVRELKGAPLACLTLLLLAGQPVSNDYLCMMSGYTDKPVAQALRLLSSAEYQLAKRYRGGWVLNKIQQFILGENCESRNISVPTTTTTLILKPELNTQVVVATRKNSDTLYESNLEACNKVGIGDPSASKISDLEHVTADFIKAHIDSLKPGETRGLAIRRIEYNELPASWDKKEIPVGKSAKPVNQKVAALRARAESEDIEVS